MILLLPVAFASIVAGIVWLSLLVTRRSTEGAEIRAKREREEMVQALLRMEYAAHEDIVDDKGNVWSRTLRLPSM